MWKKIYIPAGTTIRSANPESLAAGVKGAKLKMGFEVWGTLEDGVYTFDLFGKEYTVAAEDVQEVK